MDFLNSVIPDLLLWLMRVSALLFVLLAAVGLIEWLEGRQLIPPKPAKPATSPESALPALPDHASRAADPALPPSSLPAAPRVAADSAIAAASTAASWGRGNHFVRPDASGVAVACVRAPPS